MSLDVQTLRDFYGSNLGDVSRRLIGRVIGSRWDKVAGLTVAALGYGLPFLDKFRKQAACCVILMPAEQGAILWPEGQHCATALVPAQMLPLPDGSIDRLLVAHAIEQASQPDAILEEVWRVVAPQGRIILIVPSRRGMWARTDGTPFGRGLPYSKAQLRELLHRAVLSPIFWGEALYLPPMDRQYFVRSALVIERMGAALSLPFAGVHIVEAIKQVHRPIDAPAAMRIRPASVQPAFAPRAQRQI